MNRPAELNEMFILFRRAIRLRLTEAHLRFLVWLRYWFKDVLVRHHGLNGKVIVSLTSFLPRFPKLHLTLKTLLSQKIRPDLVVLCVYEKDFEQLPASVLSLVGESFCILTTPRDTRSFKKLIPTLKRYPDAFIVTADDDVYYRRNWLEEMVNAYDPLKKEILGHRAHHIRLDVSDNPMAYMDWSYNSKIHRSGPLVFLTGVGGIFYPPHSLDAEVFNESAYLELCPTADDIWFYFMTRRAGFIARKIGGRFPRHNWLGTQEMALNYSNIGNKVNDVAMIKMIERYGRVFDDSAGK